MLKRPLPVDALVGRNIRICRLQRGLTQTELGDHLGVTFQQIQKYEKGSNRISASRLQHTARVLEVSPGYFFEGAPADSAREAAASRLVASIAASDCARRITASAL